MTIRTRAIAVLFLAGAALVAPANAVAAPSQTGLAHSHRPVCGPNPPGRARCHSDVVTGSDQVTPLATTSPSAGSYGPADLRAAYALPAAGSGKTVAVVDAYDDPAAESDLAAYRSQFGLPPCTTANGCFRKVNQSAGASPLPAGDAGWGKEIALDLDMVSAACPACSILLVEANSNSLSDLGAGVDTAAAMGANAISNSYGTSEFNGETTSESHWNHPGRAITVSTGDTGYGVQFPAASRYVTAVGGTSLTRDTTNARGWTEKAWSGGGSGCSAYVPKPSWQTDTGCAQRTVADVAAVANPQTGMAVYDSYGSSGGANWYIMGGTSAAAPIVAAVYAMGGQTSAVNDGSGPYADPTGLFDVTAGSNGTCSPSYLCTAVAGVDGPTGLGTPNGTAAFASGSVQPAPATLPAQLVANGGFETGSLASWLTAGGAPAPSVSAGGAHSGTYGALLGTPSGNTPGKNVVYQNVAIPSTATQASLTFWYRPFTADTLANDWQEAQIRSTGGTKLAQVFKTASNSQAWTAVTFDVSRYRGQTIQLWFNVHQNGNAKHTYMYLDDVSLAVSQ